MADTSLYEILELSPGAAADEIKAAYRQISSQVHPDRGGTNALFRLVREAYDILSDDIRRAEYDRSRLVSSSTRSAGSAGGDPRLDEVRAFADRSSALNKSLAELRATATTDRDNLEVCRVQLELTMAQIAWNMAVFRQLSAQGKMEAAARFHAKANEAEKSLPAIERLITRIETLIDEKAHVQPANGSSSVRMIACSRCSARNRVSVGTESFSCGSCHYKHRTFTCNGCVTSTYIGVEPDGSSAPFVCETCEGTKRERRRAPRHRGLLRS
jgi:curved DNA-binding protein CbpA